MEDTDCRVLGPVRLRYYGGESSQHSFIPNTDDHGRASLLESVGHFCDEDDVVNEFAHQLGMLTKGNEIVAIYAREYMRLQCFTPDWIHPNTICQWFMQGLNSSIRCILSGLGNHTNIEATIDMAYECERIVANPQTLDHMQNMEDLEEEEEEDDKESNTSQNH
ncbi:hypothetical protein SAY87_015057 [Trapa incisa]|uniref:Retrotransposon gag domain-containing protein n=1 Tax=Trapa incisa TaxID=236973 RepID=A0AAN7GPL4_9MYRT|nr:hypothetical protein SAY87_015057 [Trapa incisa]